MVAAARIGRPKYADSRAIPAPALRSRKSARARLLNLADDDARAFAGFAAARKMPRETEDEQKAREAATQAAARLATDIPMTVVRQCRGLMIAAEAMSGRSNLNAASDLEVAARLARSCQRRRRERDDQFAQRR